jgi:peptidoglycan L-alanyl-D-glutamate endopeptidase CwlK
MTFRLSARSLKRLVGVHPDLVRVVKHAIGITSVDFTVLEGVRSAERQQELVLAGASQTMNSRHIAAKTGWGHAVDLGAYVAGEIRWDWPLYHKIAVAMIHAASELGVPLEWGGDWKFKDGPHYQLPWKDYP